MDQKPEQPGEQGPSRFVSNDPRIPTGGGGVTGIWYRAGRVLLTRRAAGIPYPNKWCFPGGGIEAGEDEATALQREWREELGTSVRLVRRMGSVEVTNARGTFPLHWYFVTCDDDAFQPNPAEVAEVRWIPLEEVLAMPDLLGSNRQMLASLGENLRAACEAACAGIAISWRDDLRRDLGMLREKNMHRRLREVDSPMGRTIRLEGREVLNFASNDYLGLAGDPRVARAAGECLERFGWGAGGSRLVCGHTSVHAELERALAAFKRTESAIVLPTGYMANLAAIRTLAGPQDVVLLDKLNHASIIDAAGASGAEVRVFPHLDHAKLERLLERYAKARRRLIVTDSVFSMDGDVADLPRLVALKSRYDAMLLVDEAHATGVLGPSGRGLAELQSVEAGIDVTIGTLSKALGGVGGFLAGPAVVTESIVNHARSFIFTTGLPAAACAAAIEALRIVEAEPERREKVLDLAKQLRSRLATAGWDTGRSQAPIVPVGIGQAERALRISEFLLDRGMFCPAIRPPAVGLDSCRLRVSVTADHEPGDVDLLVAALASWTGRGEV